VLKRERKNATTMARRRAPAVDGRSLHPRAAFARVLRFCLSAAVAGLLGLPARAQESSGEWTVYTSMRDIGDLLVYRDAVWAVTTGGVLRFDQQTRRYTRFTRLDGLAGNQVSSLAVDPRGHLWFGTDHQGLSRFRPETGRFDPPFLDFEDLKINALVSIEDRIFVGTERGISAFLIDKEEVKETYRQLGRLSKDTEVTALAVFSGKLWAGTTMGIAQADLTLPNLQDPDSWTSTVRSGQVRDFLVFRDTLYCAASRGVWRVATPTDEWLTLDLIRNDIESLGIFEDMVTGASRDGTIHQRRGWLEWEVRSSPWLEDVRAIARSDTTLWVATIDGLQVIGGEPPPPPKDPGANHFYDMALTDDGELWVASVPKDNIPPHGVYQFEGADWTIHDITSGLPTDFAANVGIDAAGQVWVGTWGKGVAVRDTSGTWQRLDQSNSVLRGCCGDSRFVAVSDIVRDADGRMWVANVQVGVAVMDGFPSARGYLYEQATLKIQRDMDNLAIGLEGLKWIATATEGFILFDDGGTPFTEGDEYARVFNTMTETRLTSDRTSDILVDRSGQVWVATDNGLNAVRGTYSRSGSSFRVDNWRVYNTANGLPSNEVNTLEEDARGNVWVGTEDGLAQISAAGDVAFVLTPANSGLIDRRVKSLLFDARRGELWIGTFDGLSRLRVEQGEESDAVGLNLYPNPFVVGTRGATLTFTGLPLGASLDIFTLDGQRVRHLKGTPGQGTVVWDGQNAAGFLVGSGIYFFVARDEEGHTVTGKFAAINER